MDATPLKIREITAPPDAAAFRELIGAERPAVMRGLVSAWPAVREAEASPAALVAYLARFDTGTAVDAIMTPPEAEGQIGYNDTLSGFNFVRNRLPLGAVAEQVLRYARAPRPPAVAAQSALVRDCVPGFAAENRLPYLDDSVPPRIWLGNAITTPAHLDEWNNIGCVVSGRRRFTLFPPEQIANLYIGPVDFAPTGAPMSLVSLRRPDFARFPKFRVALAAAQVAELGAGDALYIPPLWWHHVESLQPFNVLVNYWWYAAVRAPGRSDSGFDALMHAILTLRHLPPATRRAWGAVFEHYLFGPDSAATAHIPAAKHGVLGTLSPEGAAQLRAFLAGRLQG